jgi:hypothetical protein
MRSSRCHSIYDNPNQYCNENKLLTCAIGKVRNLIKSEGRKKLQILAIFKNPLGHRVLNPQHAVSNPGQMGRRHAQRVARNGGGISVPLHNIETTDARSESV